MIIEEYLAHLDGPAPLDGLTLMEPDVEFLIALPGKEVTGTGQGELGAYIRARPPVGRRHNIVRRGCDGDLEMVYGFITEGQGRGTGSFACVGLVSAERRLARYQAFFHPTFGMFPLPEAGAA